MYIHSATFIKGVVGPDPVLDDGLPQVAFIGRSNVGKSSTINALVGVPGLARTSATPGRTQELNVYLLNRAIHLIDLPGYGYASASKQEAAVIRQRIEWYLFQSPHVPRLVVMIVDALVGATASDMEVLEALERRRHEVVIVANKVDKLRPSAVQRQMVDIGNRVGGHRIIPFSAEKKIGVGALSEAILR